MKKTINANQNPNMDLHYKKMTETPIPVLIAGLSIPTIITMLITNIYNLVDTAFVGTLGNSASGAIGVVFGFMAILQAFGFLFGQGAGSIMSRRLGNKDLEGAQIIASTGFFLSLFIAILLEIIGFCTLDHLVMLLGSTKTIAPYAKTYIAYILFAAPFVGPSFTLNNLLRYEGKAKLGMIGMMTGAILNICGDAIFILGFDMGIHGAGLSTAISQIVSFVLLLLMFLNGKTQCRLSLKYFRFRVSTAGDIVATGFPSLIRQGLGSISTMLLNGQAAVYGDPAVAAMSIVSRIVFFVFSVSVGIGQGFQPVCAFNYGAKRYDRVKKGFWITLLMSEIVLAVLSAFTLLFSGNLIQLFRDDAEVIAIGTRALLLQCSVQLILPISMVTEMMLQSSGRRISATLLSSMRSGLFFIPSLLILAKLRGLYGIQESQPVAFVLTSLASIFFVIGYFRRLNRLDRESSQTS